MTDFPPSELMAQALAEARAAAERALQLQPDYADAEALLRSLR